MADTYHLPHDRFKQLADYLAQFQLVQSKDDHTPLAEIKLYRNVTVDGFNFPAGQYFPERV